MSHQQNNLNGGSDRSALPSYGIPDLDAYPLPNHERYLSRFPDLSSRTDGGDAVLHEGRPIRDMVERRESTTSQYVSSYPALEIAQAYLERNQIAYFNHLLSSGSSIQRSGLTSSPTRDEQLQTNAPAPSPNSSEQEIQEHFQRRPAQHQRSSSADRARRHSQPQTMPQSAGTNTSGSRPNREQMDFEYDYLFPGVSQHTTITTRPDVASQPSLGSPNRSSPLARGSQNRFPLSLQGLQHARAQVRFSGRGATAARPARRKPPPASIVRYTALSASDASDGSDSECPICQDSYDGDQHIANKLLTTPCAHTFGRSCLQQWINSGMDNAHRCPTCRQSIAGALSAPQPSCHLGLVIGARHALVIQELERERARLSALRAEFGQRQQEPETGPTIQEERLASPAGLTHQTIQMPDIPRFTASEIANPDPYYLTEAYSRGVASIERARELDLHTLEQLQQAQWAINRSQQAVARSQVNISRAREDIAIAQGNVARAQEEVARAQERSRQHGLALDGHLDRLRDRRAQMTQIIQRRQAERAARISGGGSL